MPVVQVRCHTCGTRVQVTLGDTEARALRTNRTMFRSCRICRGTTRHELLREDSSGALRQPEFEVDLPDRKRILVIDDDPGVRTILSSALGAAGFDVVPAESGRDALSMLVRDEFDVILTDVHMAELDGRQLFAFLGEHLSQYKERVIFITGDTSNPETMIFLGETGRPFLSKPLDLPQLVATVEQLIASN
jgi:CheY-like chemotaxis protein